MITESYDEWRLVFEVGKRIDIDAIVARGRDRTPADVDLHKRGQQILVYAFSKAEIQLAGNVVAELLAGEGAVTPPPLVSRWNPGRERWQDPSLPVDPPRWTLGPEWAAAGELEWEVRLRSQSGGEARRVAEQLLAAGRPTILGLRNRVTVGLETEREARQLAGELRNAAPTAEIAIRPLSRWRRWIIRQRLLGNYAGGGGGGDWGDGGGGNGGGA